VDIIDRSSRIFDKVIVTLAINLSKQPMFNVDDRLEMITDAIKSFKNVTVEKFDGLVVDFAQKVQATAIIRGIRAITDFEYEFQMALMNHHLAEHITTVFLMPNEKYTYLNSSIIRNVALFNGDIQKFVTKFVADKLIEIHKKD
jgi:pantetheine-phosphate adenylyltransferase